jgi:endonuclease/exonuclease/phosphatase family metal-dependent hydrolase
VQPHLSFSVATWNILATGYIRREFYPMTPRELLDPAWRVPALVRHAAALEVDILCLQEVEAPAFTALRDGLAAAGYTGMRAAKGRNRPDGCATFFRAAHFSLIEERRIAYADGSGEPDSGHIAQLLILGQEGRRLAVLNTHLKWDSPGTPRERQWAYRQIQLAIEALRQAGPLDAQIVCGDFNVTPDSDAVEALRAAGMDYAHRDLPGIATCNSNRNARLIDFLFHTPSLRAHAFPPPTVNADTVLPSSDQPSDHVPLAAQFDWVH